jgi:4,5-dihydroxyphthalate decarboxylase
MWGNMSIRRWSSTPRPTRACRTCFATAILQPPILGNDLPDGDEFAPVISDHAAADRTWYSQHGFMPINHMVVVSQGAARDMPDAVRAAYGLLKQADAEAPAPADGLKRTMFGFERLRDPIQFTLDTCRRQLLLPRTVSVDELFADAQAILGDLGA